MDSYHFYHLDPLLTYKEKIVYHPSIKCGWYYISCDTNLPYHEFILEGEKKVGGGVFSVWTTKKKNTDNTVHLR